MRFRILHGRLSSIGNVIRQVDQKLGQAALGGCIVAQNRRKCGVSERLRQTLPQCLASSAVVAQSIRAVRELVRLAGQGIELTEGNSAQHA